MTIAAGVVCTDGVVVCADTEITEGNAKYEQMKIWAQGDYLLLTGSGSSDYLKMAADKLAGRFIASRPDTPFSARDAVEKLVRGIYNQQVLPFHHANYPYAQDLGIYLIVAVRCANGDLALIKTSHMGAFLSSEYASTGAGSEVFNYWAKHFLVSKMPMDVASYFCLFMLREAKNSASGCGGSTHVLKMNTNPNATKVLRRIFDDRTILAGFPESVVQVLLSAVDLRKTDLAFDSDLQRFRTMVSQLRGAVRCEAEMHERAKIAFEQTERVVAGLSASTNAPEPPPEQSPDAAPKKASRRGRRRP